MIDVNDKTLEGLDILSVAFVRMRGSKPYVLFRYTDGREERSVCETGTSFDAAFSEAVVSLLNKRATKTVADVEHPCGHFCPPDPVRADWCAKCEELQAAEEAELEAKERTEP